MKIKRNLNRSGQQKQIWKGVNNLHTSKPSNKLAPIQRKRKTFLKSFVRFNVHTVRWSSGKHEAKPDHKLSHDHPDLVKTADTSSLAVKVAL